jgi:tetratricopeptide (TPR) repeat protein
MRVLTRFRSKFNLYKEWIRMWKSLPVESWIQGAELYKGARYEEAIEFYLKGLKAHPLNPARAGALLDLAHCYYKLKRFCEAEQYLRQVIVAFPNEREGYVRLARLQLWLGLASEAAWTIRSCLQKISPDPELVTLFVTAVVETGGVAYFLSDAREMLANLHCEREAYPRLEVAKARFEMLLGESESARDELAKLAALDRGPFDAVVSFASVLLEEGKTAYARHHLHRSLIVSPEHPKVLRLLARSYLTNGPFFEPEYAVQLAVRACQSTAWQGIHEMHTLADAYALSGDKVSALLAASKAKEVGRKLLGSYPESKQLDKLIYTLSSGTRV